VPLFRDAVARRRTQELQAFEGRTIAHKESVEADWFLGWQGQIFGEAHGLKSFEAKFDDGSHGRFSAAEIRNRLMPDGM